MTSLIVGGIMILATGGWIAFDYWRSKSRLDSQHSDVVQSCKIEPDAYVSPLLSTVDLDTMVQTKAREVEDLRRRNGHTSSVSKDTTRVMRPVPRDPQSDTAILKVVVDQAEEVRKAAREKVARRK